MGDGLIELRTHEHRADGARSAGARVGHSAEHASGFAMLTPVLEVEQTVVIEG